MGISLFMTLLSLLLLLTAWGTGPLDTAVGLLGAVLFGSFSVLHLINLARGKEMEGLLVDGEGIGVRKRE